MRKGAHAAITVDAAAATGARRGGLWRLVDTVRGRAEVALGAGLALPQAALLRGMALGQDEALSERTRDEFRTAGSVASDSRVRGRTSRCCWRSRCRC